jgi:hypothetical protein
VINLGYKNRRALATTSAGDSERVKNSLDRPQPRSSRVAPIFSGRISRDRKPQICLAKGPSIRGRKERPLLGANGGGIRLRLSGTVVENVEVNYPSNSRRHCIVDGSRLRQSQATSIHSSGTTVEHRRPPRNVRA